MNSRFPHHNSLRLFSEIARFQSFSDAALALNMTKGAVSYQIKTLEAELKFELFERKSRGVTLTKEAQDLLVVCDRYFTAIEAEIGKLMGSERQPLTVGMSSYFASRWLSPRLMTFMQENPNIQLRIQPMTQLFNLEKQEVDVAIRWGDGAWGDVEITPLMPLPAWPTGNLEAAALVQNVGLESAFSEFTLLRDHDGSSAWSEWCGIAKVPLQTRKDTLIIPDPNVRVQAVIDGQGIALNDALVDKELEDGTLVRLSEIELKTYGYFIARPRSNNRAARIDIFVEWLRRMCV